MELMMTMPARVSERYYLDSQGRVHEIVRPLGRWRQQYGLPEATASIIPNDDGSLTVYTQWDIERPDGTRTGIVTYPAGSSEVMLLQGLLGHLLVPSPRASQQRIVQVEMDCRVVDRSRKAAK